MPQRANLALCDGRKTRTMVPDPQSLEGDQSQHDATQYMSVPRADRKTPAGTNSGTNPTIPAPVGGADLSLGEEVTLGEFRLLRRLGRGGMSEVYLAEQTLLKRHVAIKVMRPELMLDESLRQRFQKEALAVAGLNHPNIVQIYTVGEAEGRIYIAQEYVNGQNLREYLTRKGPPDLPVAVHIMKQVAAALQAAGQAGIVHRDIKPENIMLARKGEVKVADFGLAKRSQQAESQQLTQLGTTMGTPLYMSPEQVNGTNVDERSDLYSFGVTCYHMLAGQPPFRGDNAVSIAVQHLRGIAKPLEKIRPDLPPLLCRIVHKLMEKDPDTRYQTAAAVIKDLKRVAQQKNHGTDAKPLQEESESPGTARTLAGRLSHALRNPVQYAIRLADMPVRRQLYRLIPICLIAMALSAGIGWIRRPGDPLQPPPANARGQLKVSAVPKRETAEDQWSLAVSRGNDIAAWKAVIDHFPSDKVYTPQALIKLGLLYVAENRLDEAQPYFDKLVAYGELDPEWQAAGWMGQALVLNRRHDYAGSQQLLEEKGKQLQAKLPPRLREIARTTLQSNASELHRSVDDQLKKLFEE